MKLWTIIVWHKAGPFEIRYPYPLAHIEAETEEDAAKVFTFFELHTMPEEERYIPEKDEKDGHWYWRDSDDTYVGDPFLIAELKVIRYGDVKKAD